MGIIVFFLSMFGSIGNSQEFNKKVYVSDYQYLSLIHENKIYNFDNKIEKETNHVVEYKNNIYTIYTKKDKFYIKLKKKSGKICKRYIKNKKDL